MGIWRGQDPGIPDSPGYFEGARTRHNRAFRRDHTRPSRGFWNGTCPTYLAYPGVDECRIPGIPGIPGDFQSWLSRHIRRTRIRTRVCGYVAYPAYPTHPTCPGIFESRLPDVPGHLKSRPRRPRRTWVFLEARNRQTCHTRHTLQTRVCKNAQPTYFGCCLHEYFSVC